MAAGGTHDLIWAIIQDSDRQPITPGPGLVVYAAARRRLKELGRQDDLVAMEDELRRATGAIIEGYVRVRGTGYRPERAPLWPDLGQDEE